MKSRLNRDEPPSQNSCAAPWRPTVDESGSLGRRRRGVDLEVPDFATVAARGRRIHRRRTVAGVTGVAVVVALTVLGVARPFETNRTLEPVHQPALKVDRQGADRVSPTPALRSTRWSPAWTAGATCWLSSTRPAAAPVRQAAQPPSARKHCVGREPSEAHARGSTASRWSCRSRTDSSSGGRTAAPGRRGPSSSTRQARPRKHHLDSAFATVFAARPNDVRCRLRPRDRASHPRRPPPAARRTPSCSGWGRAARCGPGRPVPATVLVNGRETWQSRPRPSRRAAS